MIELLFIFKDIVLPVFLLMGMGFLLQKKFNLEINSFTKLNIYLLVPGFIFVKLYSTEISLQLVGTVLVFFILYIFILYLVSTTICKTLGFDQGRKTAFSNSVIFYNSGNYGVPVNDLVFKSDPVAMSVQVIVLTFQNIFLFSYGIFALQSINNSRLKAAIGYLKMPVLYAMLAGMVFNYYKISIPSFLWVPANYIADAMVSMALVTLGVQVARLHYNSGDFSLYLSIFLRLLIGPIIALVIIFLFNIEGIIAKALLISSAMPTSVNSAVLAQEYNNHPNFASQAVMFSTLISALTVSVAIYLANIFF